MGLLTEAIKDSKEKDPLLDLWEKVKEETLSIEGSTYYHNKEYIDVPGPAGFGDIRVKMTQNGVKIYTGSFIKTCTMKPVQVLEDYVEAFTKAYNSLMFPES